jgi:hypothetical protein
MQNDSTVAPARANPQPIGNSRHAVAAVEIDHAARSALMKIEGIACDLQGLLDIAASRHIAQYQRDAATSAARNLATLSGAICVAATCESIPPSVSLWLLGGQA